MNLLMLSVLLFFSSFNSREDPKLATVRKLYYLSAEDRFASENLSNMVRGVDEQSPPIFMCYKGAAFMMEAKHAVNPFTKLSRFKKGREVIEKAIDKDPEQPEMRFIRFTIQTNLPTFLGYNKHIEMDKRKLLATAPSIGDKILKDRVISYLIASKKCNETEIKKLQN